MTRPAPEDTRLTQPRCWSTAAAVAGMWLVARLPRKARQGLGWLLGHLIHAAGRRRRFIARVNIELAFPDLDERSRKRLVRQSFVSAARGMLETATAWFGPEWQMRNQVEIRGLEYLDEAIQTGRGVIMLGSHTTSIEICGRALGRIRPFHTTYKPDRNPCFERVMRARRIAIYGDAIPVTDMRRIVRTLKSGGIIWYAPDQNYGKKNSVFVPFFGIDTATTTGTVRLARLGNAVVLPCFSVRRPDGRNLLEFQPMLEGFPGEDSRTDTARVIARIENYMRQYPEQYLWMHSRYKDHPEGGLNRYERYRQGLPHV
ncbi:MAG: lipid A biosynthesis lauroyl acyltransferase [Gammaproteobacteria bacterium]|nr:MAG: lipid A biosynthesis lauroyl acyltransferase [Gammaproteobacteria bacterium]